MCGPVLAALPTLGTFGTISTALTAGAGLLGAYGQYQNAGVAAKAAEATAKQQQAAARRSIESGNDESDRLRRDAAKQRGAARARMAANGIDPNTEDAMSMLEEDRSMAEADAFTIRENSRLGAASLSQSAANSQADAITAKSRGLFEPMGTLLTTGAKVGSKYAGWAAQREVGAY